MKESEELYSELIKRYVFSDILIILNETDGLFSSLKSLLDEKYKDDPRPRFTSEMINRIFIIEMRLSNIANRPENQQEVVEVLKSMESFINSDSK